MPTMRLGVERAVRREKTRARRRTTSGPRTASSAPRLYIGYMSSQCHIRQPQAASEPAVTRYCLKHHRQLLDLLVSSCS